MKAKVLIIIILLILVGGIIMTGIVHERIVASRDKGMATDWNADHNITGDTDMNQSSWLNEIIENRVDWPAAPVEGQRVYRSDLKAVYVFDGTGWSLLSRRVNYWSCPGSAFTTAEPDIEDVWLDFEEGWMEIVSGGAWPFVPVNLPHGAVVTGVIVYGTASDEPWWMRRIEPTNPGWASTMATANINTEDTTITNPTIDNQNYNYQIHTDFLSVGDYIFGARITYTL